MELVREAALTESSMVSSHHRLLLLRHPRIKLITHLRLLRHARLELIVPLRLLHLRHARRGRPSSHIRGEWIHAVLLLHLLLLIILLLLLLQDVLQLEHGVVV